MADQDSLADDARILRALYQLTRGVDSRCPVESPAAEPELEPEPPPSVVDTAEWDPPIRRPSPLR